MTRTSVTATPSSIAAITASKQDMTAMPNHRRPMALLGVSASKIPAFVDAKPTEIAHPLMDPTNAQITNA